MGPLPARRLLKPVQCPPAHPFKILLDQALAPAQVAPIPAVKDEA